MPDTEHWGEVTRKAVTHRRTHHPWWPRGTGVTLGRKRQGLGVSWGGCRVASPRQHTGEPRCLTLSPGLPSLPSSPSKPAGPCGDKVRVSEGGLHRGAVGVPEGPALGSQGMGTGPWGRNPASTQEHRDTAGSCPLYVVMGGLTWMPGGPGGPGGPGIPVGPRMPSLPCKSHRRVMGAARTVPCPGTPWPPLRAGAKPGHQPKG